MAQVERAIRHTREQQRTGRTVHRKSECGKQAEQRCAAPEQLTSSQAIVAHHQTGGSGRGDIPAGQHGPGPHRNPRHPAADRSRRLREEEAKDDHVAQARSDLERNRGQRPRRVHISELVEHLPGRRDPDKRADGDRADDRGGYSAQGSRPRPPIRGAAVVLIRHVGEIFPHTPSTSRQPAVTCWVNSIRCSSAGPGSARASRAPRRRRRRPARAA